ncbi:ABC transporter ATP-binding protein [Rathayibacter rathayi]|uniref:ABC transporter ATP-binding protein n=1 Tax=Rathayibacter rathayi TaxID=33887 RepID=UPI000CE8C3AB|nr:ABC transporter ATP-binding protein [Rathayibacter rathayi]PPG69706.1 multidrug ABC transporter permease [Rathayibacter rathayi]PPG76982.1 multidrug ABC transporter permease [Rathayibacter rathayi]PPI77355.1 multidrug ABC transporter permease [Rathayibacter rathayi]
MTATEQIALPVARYRDSLRWLARTTRRHPVVLTAAVATGVLSAAAALVPVYGMGWLVDATLAGRAASDVVALGVLLVVAAVAAGALSGLSTYLIVRLGETAVAILREDVVRGVLELPSRATDRSGHGDVLSRVGDDIARITRASGEVVPAVLSATLLVLVSLASLFGVDQVLGVTGLLTLPLYAGALLWYLPRSGHVYAQERVAAGERTEALASSLYGTETVHAYGLEAARLGEIRAASDHMRALSVSVFRLLLGLVGRVNLAEFCGLAVLFAVGFVRYTNGDVTIGAVTAAILLFHRLFTPLGTVLVLFDEAQSAGAAMNRSVGVVMMVCVRRPARATASDRSLTLEDVRFAYSPGHDVLHGVSFTVPAGRRLALVGASGAGKTTAALLAAGDLQPDSGDVRLGATPLSEIGTDALRSRIALISQDVHVVAGPLIADLRLADEDADEQAVWRALETVGADGWVRALPAGVHTEVGAQHHRLTAGQKQQIALARLVLKNPDIAILDEATAEAGSSAAAALELSALAATADRTTLVVAHRLTQAASADAIAVMAAGRIVEFGSHDDLLGQGGTYARQWDAWRGSGEPPPTP